MSQSPEESSIEISSIPALASLPREREPAADLWPGIAARLKPMASVPAAANDAALQPMRTVRRMRAARHWPYALAASVSIAALAGLLLPQLLTHSPLPKAVEHRVAQAVNTVASARLEQQARLAITPASSTSEVLSSASAALDASREMLASSNQRLGAHAYRTLRSESDDYFGIEGGGSETAASGLMHAAYSTRASQSVAHSPRRDWSAAVRADVSQHSLLKANLRLMQQAEREVTEALMADPESDSLQEMLDQLRAQQSALRKLLVATRN